MNRPRLPLLNVLALIAICSGGASAQSAFTGAVKDATGGVPNAVRLALAT